MSTPGATRKGDFLFDAFFSGAIGATAVAVVLLALDSLAGQPFRTPTLLGAAFSGETLGQGIGGVRLDLVTWATVGHFLAFGILGLAASWLAVNVPRFRGNPVVVTLLLLACMEGGIRLVAALFAPELVGSVGAGRILVANMVAAASMGGFLAYAHREEGARSQARSATA